MIFKDYYKILSLETNRVSSEQIKNAYRLAAKKNHPDLNVGNKLAEEKIKDINEAYRVLSNQSTKRKYDRMWVSNVGRNKRKKSEENSRQSDSIFSDFCYMFFGNVQNIKNKTTQKLKNNPIKGENIETSINVEIEEVFYGLNKKISLKNLNGNDKIFNLTIPAGIKNGEKIRLIGQGKAGIGGGKNGDLLIKVNILNNDKFKLKGNDLYTYVYLTPWEAALGTEIKIDSIDGTSDIKVKAGTQGGEFITVPNKGYKNTNGERGNLKAEIKIVIPNNLTKEEKGLMEELNKISNFNPRNQKKS